MELVITFLAGLSVLIGAAVIYLPGNKSRIEHLSIAVAMGALLSLLFSDLIPELYEAALSTGWITPVAIGIVGIVSIRILDRFVPEHEDTVHNHDTGNAVHIGIMSSLAVIIHNVVEGMTVYSLSCSDLRQGMILAGGIALHNIPMGMLICSTIKGRNMGLKLAVFAAVSLSTMAGGVIMFLMRGYMPESVTGALIAFATGMIIYLVFLELLPHVLRTENRLLSFFGALTGFVLVLISMMIGG